MRYSQVLPHGHCHRASVFVGLRRDELIAIHMSRPPPQRCYGVTGRPGQ
jgi:hypothetical protein